MVLLQAYVCDQYMHLLLLFQHPSICKALLISFLSPPINSHRSLVSGTWARILHDIYSSILYVLDYCCPFGHDLLCLYRLAGETISILAHLEVSSIPYRLTSIAGGSLQYKCPAGERPAGKGVERRGIRLYRHGPKPCVAGEAPPYL